MRICCMYKYVSAYTHTHARAFSLINTNLHNYANGNACAYAEETKKPVRSR